MYFRQFVDIIHGRIQEDQGGDFQIEYIYIDSRQVSQAANTIFCALKTDKRDGHQYIRNAYEKGVRYFLVSEHVQTSEFRGGVFILVEDTLIALQELASRQRRLYPHRVVGITGSNGKTIVKEWLSSVLTKVPAFQAGAGIIKSPKSYNSQVGVPLSVWRIQEEHSLAIFEAGISKPGEMDVLESIIRPDVGILTNIGDAHGEFFSGKEEKLKEKLRLFRTSKVLIYHSDNELIQKHVLELAHQNVSLRLLSWSERDESAYLYVKDKKLSRNSCDITFVYDSAEYCLSVPFTQAAYVHNALLVITALLYLDVPFDTVRSSILQLRAVAMRLEVRDAIHSSKIISDTYNSDISSLKVALDFLSQQYGSRRSIILSDIEESGLTPEENIDQIIRVISRYELTRFTGIGTHMMAFSGYISHHLGIPCSFYASTDDFLKNFSLSDIHQEIILLKGARIFEFERIQQRLELSIHQTVMEVNLDAIAHNFNEYKKQVSPSVKTMAMVKAFSYGHGGLEIAQKLQYAGAHYLAVAYADEGIELRLAGVALPIMVMSPEISGFESMIRWRLEPEIFNIYSLRLFCETAVKYQEIDYPIHIKLDTGMHRLGFMEQDIDELIAFIAHNKTVRISSIFTHLAGSDDAGLNDYTSFQNENFQRMSQKILDSIDYKPLRHISNTAAVAAHPQLNYDMVRIGIGMYGINNTSNGEILLQNVSTLKTYIVQIRTLSAGETVGYSRKGRLGRPGKIATVAIGYADGYSRLHTAAGAYMLVNGQRAPLIGTVCMDMCMLDVTDIDGVQEGDEVIVFGEELPVTQLAQWAQTIPYEILTSISKRVKRLYIND